MAVRVFSRNILKNNKILIQNLQCLNSVFITNKVFEQGNAHYGTHVTIHAQPVAVKTQKVSKAMKAYLKRAEEHDAFMKIQQLEYQIGKRHLANIMGEDPETFTQEDINNAIAYLFPSGIYDKKAHPIMKSPEEVFPARKAAEFDETGRPFHTMFYTGNPNFFKLLYDIVEELNQLYDLEERMLRRGQKPDPNQKVDLTVRNWFTKEQLELKMVEQISDIEYTSFINTMERLVSHPYSYKCKELIDKYSKPLLNTSNGLEIPKPKIDEQGRQYITAYECLRKRACGDVTVRVPGTGKISINDKDISYFDDVQPREQVLFPLIFSEMLGKCDVEAYVKGGGTSGQAGAIRYGISMCLRSFVDQEMIESMHIAGLLQRDFRCRERKKFGQEGARRKYTWKKR